MSSPDALTGTLYQVPFQGGSLVPQIVEIYDRLAERYSTKDVLVLKRLPTGIADLTQALSTELDLVGVPNVQSIAYHARNVLARETDLSVLPYEERVELVSLVIDGHDWDHEYFEGPSELGSFNRDVGKILLEASWQGGFDIDDTEPLDPLLRELETINERFHDRLAERGLVERATVVRHALDTLEQDGVLAAVQREYDAVVAVEFEEFNALERSYLARLAESTELACLAETDSSIERVWAEPEEIGAQATSLARPETPLSTASNENGSPAGIATFLATGEASALPDREPDSGEGQSGGPEPSVAPDSEPSPGAGAYRIHEASFEEQLRTVANEVEYLRSEADLRYDDVAVLLKDPTSPLEEARHMLQRAGIPVASATLLGLDQDPAVREIHALARYVEEASASARLLLETRLAVDREALDRTVAAVEERPSLVGKLERWLARTDLKARIATDAPEVEAKSQFSHVETLLDVATFLDEADYMEASWSRFRAVLERTVTDYNTSTHSADLDAEEGGVLVDTVNVLKNDQREAVFLLNVVEGEYPGDPSLTKLFPRAWLTRMSGYPNVTTVTTADVRATFSPPVAEPVTPLDEYYRQLDRRTLAIGARAAASRAYFCTFESDSEGLGRTYRASRYLQALEDRVDLPRIGEGAHEREIYTTGNVSRRVLEQPWEQLSTIRAAASTGEEEVDIGETKRLFGAIQALLDREDVDPRFVDAVHRQVEMARGEVGDR